MGFALGAVAGVTGTLAFLTGMGVFQNIGELTK